MIFSNIFGSQTKLNLEKFLVKHNQCFFSKSVGFQNGNIMIGYILFDFLGYLANTMYMYVTSGSPAQIIIIIVVPRVHVARPAVAFVA